MTSRMRELVELLGKAIHDSLTESDEISEVVQLIRAEGFDVMLMLEASIALNEISEEEEGEETAEGEAVGPFTPNDLSFLRSLRISVEGDEQAPPSAE